MYDQLADVRENHRNPLAHGLAHEINILGLPRVALVPLSYESLAHSLRKWRYGMDREEASHILGVFKGFLRFNEEKDPYRYYVAYVKHGFAIPMGRNEMAEVKKQMTTYEGFEAYLEARSYYEDAVANREL